MSPLSSLPKCLAGNGSLWFGTVEIQAFQNYLGEVIQHQSLLNALLCEFYVISNIDLLLFWDLSLTRL